MGTRMKLKAEQVLCNGTHEHLSEFELGPDDQLSLLWENEYGRMIVVLYYNDVVMPAWIPTGTVNDALVEARIKNER